MSTPRTRPAEVQEVLHRDWREVARTIDHTLLKPDATREQIRQLCNEAAHYGFACAFVHPYNVALAVSILRTTPVKVGAPVGFPHGTTLRTVKCYEAFQLLRLGADELDMVINVGALKSGDRNSVENDIRGVVEVAHANNAILKVILETSLLTRDEKALACELALAAGADFVKTSTGFAGGGATVEDIALMRSIVGDRAGVKASGGIRTSADVAAMIQAGADRIGTSTGVAIMRELGAPALPASFS
jgi:deoxyribose-phosphate aldolase